MAALLCHSTAMDEAVDEPQRLQALARGVLASVQTDHVVPQAAWLARACFPHAAALRYAAEAGQGRRGPGAGRRSRQRFWQTGSSTPREHPVLPAPSFPAVCVW